MSPLAFDKQGKPFTFDPRTEKLLVRLFRNPSARGTCCQVFDADGQPLYVDSETDHTAFRKEVGHVPGLYRLDQCDKNGDEIEDVPAAYVSIDVVRNAAAVQSGEVNPLVIIQQMAAIQADVMKTMAQQQAALMAATAEIMRAPYRPVPVVPVSELRNTNPADDDHDDDEYEEDYDAEEEGDEEAPEPTKPLDMVMKVVAPHAPEFGKWLWKKFAEFMNEMKGTQAQPAALPVAMPVAMPATPAAYAASVPMGAAAGSSFVTAPVAPMAAAPVVPTGSVVVADVNASDADVDADAFDDSAVNTHDLATPAPVASATIATAMPSATSVTETAPTAAPVASASASAMTAASMSATSTIAATELPVPTPEQLEHLYAIRERLAPKERAIAERAISRMDPPLLVHWLAELSSMSIEDATSKIRGLIAQIPPRQPTQR
jgi:hypothetical protein